MGFYHEIWGVPVPFFAKKWVASGYLLLRAMEICDEGFVGWTSHHLNLHNFPSKKPPQLRSEIPSQVWHQVGSGFPMSHNNHIWDDISWYIMIYHTHKNLQKWVWYIKYPYIPYMGHLLIPTKKNICPIYVPYTTGNQHQAAPINRGSPKIHPTPSRGQPVCRT